MWRLQLSRLHAAFSCFKCLSTGESEQPELQQVLIHILLFKVRPLLAGLT